MFGANNPAVTPSATTSEKSTLFSWAYDHRGRTTRDGVRSARNQVGGINRQNWSNLTASPGFDRWQDRPKRSCGSLIIPAIPAIRSLRSLLLTYQCAFLLLVINGGFGGIMASFWQQSSEESVRLNALMYGAQQVRGDLYAQLKGVTRARLMKETTAIDQYASNLPGIAEQFRELQNNARRAEEREAIDSMERTYQTLKDEMSKVFTEPYVVSNDCPTQARVENVLQCMARQGAQSYNTMYSCICSINKIAEQISYKDFSSAEMLTYLWSTPGERVGVFRDAATESRKRIKSLANIRKEAEASCFAQSVEDQSG